MMTQRGGAWLDDEEKRRTSRVNIRKVKKCYNGVCAIYRVLFARGGRARVRRDVVRKDGWGAPSGALAALG